jgi:hypothetical protein
MKTIWSDTRSQAKSSFLPNEVNKSVSERRLAHIHSIGTRATHAIVLFSLQHKYHSLIVLVLLTRRPDSMMEVEMCCVKG